MKVLHIIDSGGLYGAEVVLLNLLAEQIGMGLDPIIASIGERDIEEKLLEKEALKRGYRVEKFRMRPGPNFLGACKILKFSHQIGIDLMHSHGYKGNILFGFMPKGFRKIPLVSTLHGWTSTSGLNKLQFYQWLDLMSLRFIDAVVLVNKGMLSNPRLRSLNGLRLFTVNNGIPAKTIQQTQAHQDLDQEVINFCEGGYTIGSIGRLSTEKGYKYLIEALALLNEKEIDPRLVIIGDGPERNNLEDLASRCELSNRILMPGYLEEAKQYIPFFNVFVISSLTEGLPIVLLEAMQAKVPVVASAVGGIPDALDDGNAGLLVEPCKPQDLSEAVSQIYNDPKTVERLIINGHQRTNSLYSSRNMAQEYLEIYKQII